MSRLEGVEAVRLPAHLEAAQSAEPPDSVRAGACHSDRLRLGCFIYANAGPPAVRRRRGGAVALLQGLLLPSPYSFHAPLAFLVAAFDGGNSWVVAVEQGTLPLGADSSAAPRRRQPRASRGGRGGGKVGAAAATAAGTAGGGVEAAGQEAADSDSKVTPEEWQRAQLQRLAAVQQLHGNAAVASGAPSAQPPDAARLLLSSAPLTAAGVGGAAALETTGLAAFRAALSLHLNALAAAPADASPQHVRRMAAAQLTWVRAQAARPLLCTAQLEAALGQAWLHELQVGAGGCCCCCQARRAAQVAILFLLPLHASLMPVPHPHRIT